MKAHNNSVVLRNDGVDPVTLEEDLNAGIERTITVRVASLPTPGVGALASIFNINELPLANPFVTDDNGNYTFKANSGIYDVIVGEGTLDIIYPAVDLVDSSGDEASVSYDNSASGLSATDVQAAIDETESNTQGMRAVAASSTTNTSTGQARLDVNGVNISLIRSGYTMDGLVWAIPQGSTGVLDGSYSPSSSGGVFGLQGGGSLIAPQLIGSVAGGEIKTPLNAPTDHILFQSREPGAFRAHLEPSGVIDNGTVTKLDWMLDPYDGGPLVPYPDPSVNYRIFNIFTKTGISSGLNGENGAAIIGTKNRGDGNQWGVFTSMHFGFNDGARTCAKMYYFDTSDTEWRTPMKGQWFEGRAVGWGDHLLYGPGRLYKAVSTGTCGGTPPTHTSGTASDGGVNLEFVRNYLSHTGDIQPCLMIGDRDIMPVFGWPQVRMQIREPTLNTVGARQLFNNQSNTLAASVGVRAGENNWAVETETVGSKLEVDDESVMLKSKVLKLGKGFHTTTGASINVGTNQIISINQPSAVTITSFTGLTSDTEFTILSSNSNTTIANNANIRLGSAGAANITLTPYMALKFFVSGGIPRLITSQ